MFGPVVGAAIGSSPAWPVGVRIVRVEPSDCGTSLTTAGE